MESVHIVITIIGIGLLISAPTMWKAWLKSRTDERQLGVTVDLSAQETARMKIFADALRIAKGIRARGKE